MNPTKTSFKFGAICAALSLAGPSAIAVQGLRTNSTGVYEQDLSRLSRVESGASSDRGVDSIPRGRYTNNQPAARELQSTTVRGALTRDGSHGPSVTTKDSFVGSFGKLSDEAQSVVKTALNVPQGETLPSGARVSLDVTANDDGSVTITGVELKSAVAPSGTATSAANGAGLGTVGGSSANTAPSASGAVNKTQAVVSAFINPSASGNHNAGPNGVTADFGKLNPSTQQNVLRAIGAPSGHTLLPDTSVTIKANVLPNGFAQIRDVQIRPGGPPSLPAFTATGGENTRVGGVDVTRLTVPNLSPSALNLSANDVVDITVLGAGANQPPVQGVVRDGVLSIDEPYKLDIPFDQAFTLKIADAGNAQRQSLINVPLEQLDLF